MKGVNSFAQVFRGHPLCCWLFLWNLLGILKLVCLLGFLSAPGKKHSKKKKVRRQSLLRCGPCLKKEMVCRNDRNDGHLGCWMLKIFDTLTVESKHTDKAEHGWKVRYELILKVRIQL